MSTAKAWGAAIGTFIVLFYAVGYASDFLLPIFDSSTDNLLIKIFNALLPVVLMLGISGFAAYKVYRAVKA